MLPSSPPPPTHWFPGLHPHPTTAPGVFTTWNNRGLGWGALRQGEGGTGQVPPRGVPQDNTISTRKVANQAEMGTSFQGPYIQTLHDQQGMGDQMGQAWACGGQVGQPRNRKGRQGLRPTLTPILTLPLVTKALRGAPGGQEFPLGVPRERGSLAQPCLSVEWGLLPASGRPCGKQCAKSVLPTLDSPICPK